MGIESVQSGTNPVSPHELVNGGVHTVQSDATRVIFAQVRNEQPQQLQATEAADSGTAQPAELLDLDAIRRHAVLAQSDSKRLNPLENFQEFTEPTAPAQPDLGRLYGRVVSMINEFARIAERDRPGDAVYKDALQQLASNVDFQKLDRAAQGQVLGDLKLFVQTESYLGTPGNQWRMKDAHVVNEADKKHLLAQISFAALRSAEQPQNQTLRNTLDQVLSDNIRINLRNTGDTLPKNKFGLPFFNFHLRSENIGNSNGAYQPLENFIERLFGLLYDDGVHINRNRAGSDFIDTLAHEVSHAVNSRKKRDNKADSGFFDEHRAFRVDYEANGAGPLVGQAQALKRVFDYERVQQFYNKNEAFRNVIDRARADTDRGVFISLDEMKQRLRDAGIRSNSFDTNNHNNCQCCNGPANACQAKGTTLR